MISLNKLKKIVKLRKRVGRGISAGQGKTSGRGSKGQKSRSGNTIPVGFEGGQTPLKQRLPKFRGFYRHKNIAAKNISLKIIADNFKAGESVTIGSLKEKGLIKNKKDKIKIVAGKFLRRKLIFKFVPLSESAEELIKKAGGVIIKKKK
ncbi:MAG: 50S ribosomal protein L15 [Candidatus Berkelbacteria bacterium]|nr:50S ribosomal protein L15 [Candidatus Berkelbacteria bacterium]